jgi:hypothetical protein
MYKEYFMDINIGNVVSAGSRRNRKRSGIMGMLVHESARKLEPQYNEEAELLEMVRKARNEWLDASMSFEHVNDEELIDYFTYKMKASSPGNFRFNSITRSC